MSEVSRSTLQGALDGELPESVDEAAIERMRAVAYLLDESVRVPGTRFRIGLDPLIGTVPVVGDLVGGGLSLYIVLESAYLGVSYATLVRMLGNVAVDVAGGSIPYVGPVFDAVWKSNKRNVELVLDELTDDPRGKAGGGRSGSTTDETTDDEPVVIEVE